MSAATLSRLASLAARLARFIIGREPIMTTVTGSFTVNLNGVVTTHTITDMPYAEFWRRQRDVLRVLDMASDWGLDQILGLPPEFVGPPTGDVGYAYQVDFSGGGTSDGANTWHGIPQDASEVLGEALNAAFD